MGNLIAAFPFGGEGQFQPFISGGVGSIGMRTNVFTLPDNNGIVTANSVNSNRWGGDVGGGMMVFADRWGVRGDVRWFRASTNNNISTDNTLGEAVTQSLLSDLRFWRGTLGLAFRW
jgi:outer membrane protein W